MDYRKITKFAAITALSLGLMKPPAKKRSDF